MSVRQRRPAELAALAGGRHAVVEASAGTGKTFLLEHLVVDILLRTDTSMSEILVVTFTEKATEELVTRVRRKIAALAAVGPDADQGPLPEDECWTIGEREREKLGRALVELDRATIATIHAFCQRVLVENAFLHGRLLVEQTVDGHEAFSAALRDLLRGPLPSDPALRPTLEAWLAAPHSAADLDELLWGCHSRAEGIHGPGRRLLRPAWNEAALRQALDAVRAAVDGPGALRAALAVAIRGADQRARAIEVIEALLEHTAPSRRSGDAAEVLRAIDATRSQKGVPEFETQAGKIAQAAPGTPAARLRAALEALAGAAIPLAALAAHRFLPLVTARLDARKRTAGVYDFQDMLSLVAEGLDGPHGDELVRSLRARYRYALIDELQDTDGVQWHIFRRVFFESGGANLMTVIGDPKQAIYGFRGADVHTYLAARDEIVSAGGTRLALTRTFRSTAPLTSALNALLDQQAPHPVLTGAIGYDEPVTCGQPEMALVEGTGAPAPPIKAFRIEGAAPEPLTAEMKRTWKRAIVGELLDVLGGRRPLTWRAGGQDREVGPADVLVLTRTNAESDDVGAALASAGIPHAQFEDGGLFQSVEAVEVRDLLAAIETPEDWSARARAWITPFFELRLGDLEACRELPASHPLIRRLLGWKGLADAAEWDLLFSRIVDESGLARRQAFLDPAGRRLTNVLHLFEVLLEEAGRTRCSLAELRRTLAAYVAGTRRPPGSAVDKLRLAHDAAAVRIMTVHQAKGLESVLVFLYGGTWRLSKRLAGAHVLRRAGGRQVHVGWLAPGDKAQEEAEEDEEGRRLLYVALTRARGRLYLPCYPRAFKNLKGSYQAVNAQLIALLDGAEAARWAPLFEQVKAPADDDTDPTGERSHDALAAALSAWTPPRDLLTPAHEAEIFTTARRTRAGFAMTSYTAIRRSHGGYRPPAASPEDIAAEPQAEAGAGPPGFGGGGPDGPGSAAPTGDDLPPGRLSGAFLHAVLEKIDLTGLRGQPDLESWRAQSDVREVFQRALRQHDRDPRHLSHAERLVFDGLSAPVRLGPQTLPGFAAVAKDRRELEFLYPIPEAGHPRLAAGDEGGGRPWSIGRGYVKGYVDFVFENEGFVYFCDWKSDSLRAFTPEAVDERCRRSYGLQARIYALALLRMLGIHGQAGYDSRFGGIVYAFLRGMRRGDPRAGIHFSRPTWSEILAWEEEMRSPSFPWVPT